MFWHDLWVRANIVHMVPTLLCFVVVRYWLILHVFARIASLALDPVPINAPWRIYHTRSWYNHSKTEQLQHCENHRGYMLSQRSYLKHFTYEWIPCFTVLGGKYLYMLILRFFYMSYVPDSAFYGNVEVKRKKKYMREAYSVSDHIIVSLVRIENKQGIVRIGSSSIWPIAINWRREIVHNAYARML